MLKIILVSILGYVVPRVAWLILGSKVSSKLVKNAAIAVTAFYVIVVVYFLILPNVFHVLAFVLLAVIAVMDELLGWMRLLRKKVQNARKQVHKATKTDKTWDEESIMQLSGELINHYKVDWEAKDIIAIQKYATDRFSYHNRLFLEALNNLNRSVSLDANIVELEIMNAQDVIDNEQDNFTVYVTTEQDIKLLKNGTKKDVIVKGYGNIEEVYQIEREDDGWKLNASAIAVQGDAVAHALFQDYAHRQGFYYNNRTSYLLLPYDDQLSFNSFSDTGHMILGVHSNLLVSIFLLKAATGNCYVTATTTLPGKYPHILIRSRETSDFATNKLHRVSVEWPEFNENYDLFVREKHSEKILLALLTPELVDYLLALPGPVSIEILRRNVYVIFAEQEELLKQAPEILTQLHRLALTSEGTKALMGN